MRASAPWISIDLRVEPGTFYGFLGPNGAGKSTTIKMLTGLLAASGGEACVLGKNMFDADESLEAKRKIGVVPEDLALFENLTAREHLTFIGRMYLLPAKRSARALTSSCTCSVLRTLKRSSRSSIRTA